MKVFPMKKLFLYITIVLAVLAAIFTYILYSEGYFDTYEDTSGGKMEPFEMKCEAGKCAAGKCSGKK